MARLVNATATYADLLRAMSVQIASEGMSQRGVFLTRVYGALANVCDEFDALSEDRGLVFPQTCACHPDVFHVSHAGGAGQGLPIGHSVMMMVNGAPVTYVPLDNALKAAAAGVLQGSATGTAECDDLRERVAAAESERDALRSEVLLYARRATEALAARDRERETLAHVRRLISG